MDTVAELLQALDTTAKNLDRPDLCPDPARTDWAQHEEDLKGLRAQLDEGLLPKLKGVLTELADDPGLPRLRDEVAFVVAEVAAVFHVAGKRDVGARYLEEALRAGPSDLVREEIEGARKDMDAYARLSLGRWHNRSGDFSTGDRILKGARRGVSEPGLKAAYDRALNGPRPLTGGAPALFRFNGFGVALYGDRDRRPDGTYVSTHCISALFIPVWPLGAYRVRDVGHNAYEFFAKEPLSGFAKGYRWFAAAAVALAIVGSFVSSYLNSPGRRARIALEDAQALEEAGQVDEAIMAYDGVLRAHGGSVAPEAATGLMRLLTGAVEVPMTAARVDEATRLVRRYEELPSAGQGGTAASLLASAIEQWADQVGAEDEAARRARLRLLDLGVSVAQGPDQARLQEAAGVEHVALADGLREDWPLEALHHYVAADTAEGWERAGQIVVDLAPSLHEDASGDVSAVLDAAATTEPVRARIREVAATLASWEQDAERGAALTSGELAALEAVHERLPDDQRATAALADAKRAAGDLDGASELLSALGPPGQLCGSAQVALASCYLAQDRLEDADALLSRQVEARLPAYAAAAAAYDAASERQFEAALSRAEYNVQLNQRLRGVSDEQAREIVMEFIRGQLVNDPELSQLREAMVAESSVVPTALMLGTIKLRRAHGASGVRRQALLADAERLLLAIRNEAEGVPEYHLNLGQVYHRLGRADEGENELRTLLASGDLEVSLGVAHAYRELGLVGRAREVASDVYAQTENAVDLPGATGAPPSQIRSAAAVLMSLLSTRLEDNELWLSRADQDNEGVQTSLIQVRARRAYERRDLREAERLFAQVARRYEAEGEGNAAAVNNAAIAYEEQYLCSGNDAMLDRALSTLERALALQPDNSLMIGNLAELSRYRGEIDVLSQHVNTRTLRLDPDSASALVSGLLAGPHRDAVRAALDANRHHQRARELTTQEQVLAPQRTSGWQRELDRLTRLSDADGLADLERRLAQISNLDTSAYTEALEREPTEQDRQRSRDALDSSIEDAQAVVAAARRARSPATLAAALELLSRYYYARAWEQGQLEDARAGVAASREAASTWDGFGARNLASGLLTVGLLEAAPGTALERAREQDRRRFSPVFLALRASREDAGLRAALAGSGSLDEAAALRATTPRDFLGATDRAIATLADHAGLRAATAHLTGDRASALGVQVAERLTPDNPELPLWREQLQ